MEIVRRKLRILEVLLAQIDTIEAEVIGGVYQLETAKDFAMRLKLSGESQEHVNALVAKISEFSDSLATNHWRRNKAYELLSVMTGLESIEKAREIHARISSLYARFDGVQTYLFSLVDGEGGEEALAEEKLYNTLRSKLEEQSADITILPILENK